MQIGHNAGIYKILNKINGHFYIGSSINTSKRWIKHHRSALRNNCHDNPHLQNAWNKYGETAFEFSIIIYCDESSLLFYEQRFLDKYWGTKECYNIAKDAFSGMRGRKHSEKTRKKLSELGSFKNHRLYNKHLSAITKARISQSRLGKTYNKKAKIVDTTNSFYGKKHTLESKLKIASSHVDVTGENNPNCKITRLIARKIKKDLAAAILSFKQIQQKYKISYNILMKIRHGYTWKDA